MPTTEVRLSQISPSISHLNTVWPLPHLVVYLVNRDESAIALICGGGSGHEPSHAGFVGEDI